MIDPLVNARIISASHLLKMVLCEEMERDGRSRDDAFDAAISGEVDEAVALILRFGEKE